MQDYEFVPTKWMRSSEDRVFAGVLSGLAKGFGIDTMALRLGWLALVFLFGTGILLYLVLAILMPLDEKIKNYDQPKLFGVCHKLSYQYGLDLFLVRLFFFGSFLLSGGLTLLVYIAALLVLPDSKKKYFKTYRY